MITKRTDELLPGDRVLTTYGTRTVSEIKRYADNHHRIGWVIDPSLPQPFGDIARPDEKWVVEAPSKLDLAVQRAQELADFYSTMPDDIQGNGLADFRRLLDMFRDAR